MFTIIKKAYENLPKNGFIGCNKCPVRKLREILLGEGNLRECRREIALLAFKYIPPKKIKSCLFRSCFGCIDLSFEIARRIDNKNKI